MRKFDLMILVMFLFLVGCESQQSPQVVARNKSTLSGQGILMGTLPDGREVRQYEIDRGGESKHFIYVVPGSVSINHAEKQGKTTVNKVEVFIDGRPYIPED